MFRRIHPAVGFGVRRRRSRDEVVSDRGHRLPLGLPARVGSSPGRTTRSGQIRFSGMVRPVPVLLPDLDEPGRDGQRLGPQKVGPRAGVGDGCG
jgi:hypothetical protein